MPLTIFPENRVRRPRLEVFVAGEKIPYVIECTVNRGLDIEVPTAEITVPFPAHPRFKMWARVSILMSARDGQSDAPSPGHVERFNGMVTSFADALYPGAVTVHCEAPLAMAKWTFTPDEMDLKGETDVSAIIRILGHPEQNVGGVNLGATRDTIGGLELQLTDFDDVQLYWEVGQTALAAIQMIDTASQGWRTFSAASGRTWRRYINTDPNTGGALWHFREGVDILEGSATTEIKNPVNEITVTGWSEEWRATLGPDDDPFYWRMNSYWQRFIWLRDHGPDAGTIISPTEIALYILSQINKNIIKLTFTTHLDVYFQMMEVVKVTSSKLNNADQNFWVQNVQTTMSPDGTFAQTITCVSELVRDLQRPTVTPPGTTPPTIPPGQTIPYAVQATPAAAAAADIQVDFTVVAIERELATPAAISGNEGFVYTITFSDNSTSRQGTITSRTWTPGGEGVFVTPTTGSEQTFTCAFKPLEGATMTLSVTDSNGQTAEATMPVQDGTVPVHTRKLYSVTTETYEAFDGTVWRSYTPTGHVPTVVAGGPWWGTNTGLVAHSSDDLQTPPAEVAALGEAITAIWKHEAVEGDVAVGGASGGVAISHDSGATWTAGTPLANQVDFIIVSIFDANEVHVVTSDGWFKSQNAGASWSLVRAGSFRYLELSHSRNIVVTTDGVLQHAEDGTPFTGNTSPIVAATAHIRKDTFYAIAEDGTTWIQTDEGSYTLVAGEPIPAGEPYHAGAYRDGTMVDLVYFAAQDAGLFKTLDGFRTPEGYMRLRETGLLTP
jgi:hypothetical protein